MHEKDTLCSVFTWPEPGAEGEVIGWSFVPALTKVDSEQPRTHASHYELPWRGTMRSIRLRFIV